MSGVAARLEEIADELERLDVHQLALLAERTKLWKQGRDKEGLNPVDLAKLSRLKPVSVRSTLARDARGHR